MTNMENKDVNISLALAIQLYGKDDNMCTCDEDDNQEIQIISIEEAIAICPKCGKFI